MAIRKEPFGENVHMAFQICTRLQNAAASLQCTKVINSTGAGYRTPNKSLDSPFSAELLTHFGTLVCLSAKKCPSRIYPYHLPLYRLLASCRPEKSVTPKLQALFTQQLAATAGRVQYRIPAA